MKTKLFTLLLAVTASVGTMFAQVTIDGLNYNLNNGLQTAEVAKNSSASGDIIIPSSVTYNSVSYSVTSIGDEAFYKCSGLKSVTIGNSVTSIGNFAFYNCTGLKSVTIGNSVTSIGNNAFQGCTGLTSVTIPNSVTSIGERAFYKCSGLTSVTIGNSVTSIGSSAFRECSSLTSVTIPNSVTSIGDLAFYGCSGLTSVHVFDIAAWCAISFGNSNANPLTYAHNLYVNEELITDLVIPNSVTSIGSSAFYGCSGLTSVTIPNSVTSIGNYAFDGCTGLTSVTIPNSVTSIGNDAFNGCSSLTSVTIPNSVTSIGDYAFQGCTGLTSVTIPNSVTSIGDYAFEGCSGLTSVTIGNSVTSIGSRAFQDCTGLTSVTIGNSVTSIGSSAFYQCSGLTSITIPNSVTSIGDAAFEGCSGLTSPVYNAHVFAYLPTSYSGAYTIPDGIESIAGEAFNGCTGLTSVTIPNSVTSIGGNAFSGCRGLTSVTIPNSVTSIGISAFFKCYSLTSVTIEAETPPTLGKYAFYDTNSPIYVPCNTLDAYKTAWSNYASQIKYGPAIDFITTYAENGHVDISAYNNTNATICDGELFTLTPIPNYGYHFSQWSDGNTDNPRTIELTQDTTFTAEFAKNIYSISTTSANPEWGTTAGDKSVLYLENVVISATANYGYHFVKWNDNNTSNPRTISVTEDKTYTATFAKNVYSITKNAEHGSISGNSSAEYLDQVTLTANPNYGYHFTQWSDGNTDNPRTIELTQDTTFTAEFAKNSYAISTISANPEWGTTAGDTAALYLDEVEISAIPNYGYHFVRWNDYNTSNPRTVTVTRDMTYTATFAKNVYSITKNAEHGTISGNSSAEYLDFVTLTVTPDYGYHFTQWSDGLKDNPRIVQITKDTAFTAEFAYDRVGTCGKDLALTWSYDPTNKVLTIGNAGSFTENMQFGAEAPTEMEELVIGNSVTAIGANAFAGIETLKKVTIGESVKTIGEQAFYNCVNLETIFNYRPTPTNAYSTAFDGVDKFECTLYVLPSSIDMYKNASVWRDFYYTYAIGAEEATVTTNDVKVEPQDNAATLTWPTSNNAASYTIEITKEGVVFCTLIFNANGQLTGIAFAPSREGSHHAPAAIMTANGLQFTVTGLNSGTQYGYNLTAKDANDQTVATYSGSFTTTSEGIATGVEEVSSSLQGGERGRLILRDGHIYILRDGKAYTLTGQLVH